MTKIFLRNTRRGWQIFHEADKGGGAGGDKNDLDLTAENQPEPVGKTHEEKLASSKTIIGQLFSVAKKALGFENDLKAAKGEVAKLQGQFKTASDGWDAEKTEHGKTQASLTSVTTERDTEKEGRTKAEGNVTRLEKLCGIKGIDPKQTVPASNEGAHGDGSGDPKVVQDWKKLSADEKEGKAPMGSAFKFYRKHKKEIDGAASA